MKYFTAEELRGSHKDEVAGKLKNCAGKNVRYNFGIDVLNSYAKDLGWKKEEAKVLDLGTASGLFLQQLNDAGFKNLYAHDILEYLPAEVRPLVKEYKLAELSTEKLPWADNTFDAVTAWCVIPHLENPFYASREVNRVLKPGGIFLFTTPHVLSRPSIDFLMRKGYFASYRPENNHIALLPKGILEKTIFRGFKVLGTEYLVTPKVFRGWKGKLREIVFRIAKRFPKLEQSLKYRWAYNVCYVIQKDSSAATTK